MYEYLVFMVTPKPESRLVHEGFGLFVTFKLGSESFCDITLRQNIKHSCIISCTLYIRITHKTDWWELREQERHSNMRIRSMNEWGLTSCCAVARASSTAPMRSWQRARESITSRFSREWVVGLVARTWRGEEETMAELSTIRQTRCLRSVAIAINFAGTLYMYM